MRKFKKIIKTAICLNFLLIISAGIAGVSTETPASPYELIRKSLTVSEPNQNITVSELLKRYAQTQDKIQSSFRIKTRSIGHSATNHSLVPNPDKWTYHISEEDYCYDVNRYSIRLNRWLDLDSIPEKPLLENHQSFTYLRELWDGNNVYSYAWDNHNEKNKLGSLHIILNTKPAEMSLIPRGVIFGRFAGDNKRLDQIFKLYKTGVSVRDKMEKVGDFNCYVIDADVSHGKYNLWFDPVHDYQIAKAEVFKKEGNITDSRPEGKLEKGFIINDSYVVTRFEKFDGVWIPAEMIDKGGSEWPTDQYSKGEGTTKVISFTLNPDFEKLKLFELNDVKNGAEVKITGTGNASCTWKDGKIIDSYGHEVDLDNLGSPSLVGKVLPDLAQFNVKLEPDAIKNKMLLICFWDMNQRPSRNAIQTLNKRAQTLLEKNDVYMTFIHAGPVEEQAFVSWLKENEIQHPVGVSRSGLPELGYIWGVKSLPWLILTDKQHKVIAEGFGISDLDEKLGNN